MNFKVSAPKVGVSADFSYDFGSNLQEAVEKFGEDVVFKLFRQQAVIRAQAYVRGKLVNGASVEDAQNALNEWKPDAVQRTSKSPVEKLSTQFSKLSEEEKQAVLEKIKALL